jgi:hypothetical protein
VVEIADTYISRKLMPAGPNGDAYHPRLFTTAEALLFQWDLKTAQRIVLASRMI